MPKIVIANERKHGTTKLHPLDVFLQTEEKFVKELPETSFAPEEYHSGLVRREGHVRFRGKYYFLSEELIEEMVRAILQRGNDFVDSRSIRCS